MKQFSNSLDNKKQNNKIKEGETMDGSTTLTLIILGLIIIILFIWLYHPSSKHTLNEVLIEKYETSPQAPYGTSNIWIFMYGLDDILYYNITTDQILVIQYQVHNQTMQQYYMDHPETWQNICW